MANSPRLRLVVVGHVDHGKSTLVGRLLVDTGSLPEGRLEDIRRRSERASRPFRYAYVLDALADEQARGITIDSARVHFRTARRHYLVLDAPGHAEFLRNMVTGASHADAALLVIDAAEGIRENSRRHGALLSLLGVHSVVVLVNKMDQVDYREDAFLRLATEGRAFLDSVGIQPRGWIPVSGLQGDNVATGPSPRMAWYSGPSLLECLEGLEAGGAADTGAFRMYVQDVYPPAREGPGCVIVGTVESGALSAGDTVVFHPSGLGGRVGALEAFGGRVPENFGAGQAAAFSLVDPLPVERGQLATHPQDPPPLVGDRIHASFFWLGRVPLERNRPLVLKVGTARASARIEVLSRVLDAGTLEWVEGATAVGPNQVAEGLIRLDRPLALDRAEFLERTGRFVLVDDFRIAGGGIVLDDQVPRGTGSGLFPPRRSARETEPGGRPTSVPVPAPRPGGPPRR